MILRNLGVGSYPEPSSATGTLKFPCYHHSNFDSGAIVFILRWQINSEPRAKSCLKERPPVPVQIGHGPQEPGEFITCQINSQMAQQAIQIPMCEATLSDDETISIDMHVA